MHDSIQFDNPITQLSNITYTQPFYSTAAPHTRIPEDVNDGCLLLFGYRYILFASPVIIVGNFPAFLWFNNQSLYEELLQSSLLCLRMRTAVLCPDQDQVVFSSRATNRYVH